MAYKLELCEGRHNIPDVDTYLFGEIPADKVTDFQWMEDCAWSVLSELYKMGDLPDLAVDIYVTGLTPALIASLNVCRYMNLTPTLYHYDKSTGTYKPQAVHWFCGSCDAFDYYMASVQDSMQASENSDCLYNSDRQSAQC